MKDRSLANYAGDWKSVYPYLQDGTLDQVFDYKAKLNPTMTAAEYKEYYTKGYQTDIDRIKIDKDSMEFYQKGVNQGIFRKDVNYAIVRVMVGEQMDILLRSEICKSYSLAEIYETVVFMHMRGISTEKGIEDCR